MKALLPFVAISAGLPGSSSLNLPGSSSKQQSPPIRRVAVIGAGIAGLSVAHALENSPECAGSYLQAGGKPYAQDSASPGKKGGLFGDMFGRKEDEGQGVGAYGVQVHLFDSRPALDFEAGAGIQLNGGMSVLRKINPNLQAKVAAASLPLKDIRSRTKPWFGDKDPFQTLLELNVESEIRAVGGETEKALIVDGEVMCYAIMRGALQEAMLEELPSAVKKRTQFNKKLTSIKSSEDSNGIYCVFEDDTVHGPFDMVIGCDGIKSAVKQYIESGKITGEEDRSAIYSGIRISYAVQDGSSSDPPTSSSEFRQYFGDGAYALAAAFGTGKGRPVAKGAYLIVRDEDYIGPFKVESKGKASERAAENEDWTQNNRVGNKDESLERVRRAGVPDIDIGPILESADRFFELGVYFHNPFSLRGWSREVKGSDGRYCVLAGDGAHAMPPFLGQGSNQAVQDAYTLATKIFQHNANCELASSTNIDNSDKDIRNLGILLKEYENVRWPPTASITAKAVFLGYLETGAAGFLSKFRDAFFFVAGKVGIARKVFLDAATPKT